MSGVAVGEGLEGNGDASAGGFSFNEDGTCINESKESLAGVGAGETRRGGVAAVGRVPVLGGPAVRGVRLDPGIGGPAAGQHTGDQRR